MLPACYICHSDGTNSWVTTLPIFICHTTEIKLMRAPMFTLILNSNQPCSCFSKSAVMLLSKRIGLPFRRMIPDPHHQFSLPSRSHQSPTRKSPSINAASQKVNTRAECEFRHSGRINLYDFRHLAFLMPARGNPPQRLDRRNLFLPNVREISSDISL